MASRRKLQLNPAFAAAHGLAEKENASSQAFTHRLDLALKQARATGRMNVSNFGLATPLPDSIFDLRAGIQVDLSMGKTVVANYTEENLTSVDASDNAEMTGVLDARFCQFQQVQSLRFKRCGWTSIETSLKSMNCLTILDLSGNKLEEFDLSILPRASLQELNLSENNKLRRIFTSKSIALPRLQMLDISHNQIQDWDGLSLSCKQLRTFRCEHNQLREFPPPFLESAKSCLQTLDASHNPLGDVKLNFSEYRQLQRIQLDLAKLTNIPCISTSVMRLDLNCNKISSIRGLLVPATTTSPPSLLTDLLLHDNYLTEIDADEIQKCVKLRRFDLSSNKLKTLPYQLGFFHHLDALVLTGNPLYTFKASDIKSTRAILQVLRNRAPKEEGKNASSDAKKPLALQLLDKCLLNKTVINVPGKGMPGFDLNVLISDLKLSPRTAFGVSRLWMNSNRFESIPEELLPLLPKLTEISFADNALTKLPATLGTSCHALKKLDLARNRLTTHSLEALSLPISWSGSLTRLDLSTNRLVAFPMEILSELKLLESLNLSSNKLASVAHWNWLPSTLTALFLSDNQLDEIDGLVLLMCAYCPNLQSFLVDGNGLKKIPCTLGLLKDTASLQNLNLKQNPQQAIRYEVLDRSCRDQLNYLFNRLTSEQVEGTKAKIRNIKGEPSICEGERSSAPTGVSSSERQSQQSPNAIRSEETSQNSALTSATDDKKEISTLEVDKPDQIVVSDEKKEEMESSLIEEFKAKIRLLEVELDNPSLSSAKRYALKKSVAMERSKLIREERRLGLRK